MKRCHSLLGVKQTMLLMALLRANIRLNHTHHQMTVVTATLILPVHALSLPSRWGHLGECQCHEPRDGQLRCPACPRQPERNAAISRAYIVNGDIDKANPSHSYPCSEDRETGLTPQTLAFWPSSARSWKQIFQFPYSCCAVLRLLSSSMSQTVSTQNNHLSC